MSTVYEWRDAPNADFAVIGDPVAHSLSPQMHEAAYRDLGLPFRYLAIRVAPGEVPQALDRLRELGYRGTNVTVPHKGEAMAWCKHVDGFCEQVGAVNTVDLRRRAGINTDAPGFLATLQGEPVGQALVLGAGGSARALVRALVRDGWRVRLWNRTLERAQELASLTDSTVVETADPEGASLVLNTTSASLDGEELPVEWERVLPGALAYDLAYGTSPYLQTASQHGLRTRDGLDMLVEQGALSLEWWTGEAAPRKAMRAALDAGPKTPSGTEEQG